MKRKPLDPEMSAKVMRKARQLSVGHSRSFNRAADALQKAVDEKDSALQEFWRRVFDRYVRLLAGRGLTMHEWHRIHTAWMYAQGENPRHDPDRECEKYMADHYDDTMRRLSAPRPKADRLKKDDDIPF
jgi:hypothetical protein